VRHAIVVNPRRTGQLEGRRLLLVADVFITSAMVLECACIFSAAGTSAAHVLPWSGSTHHVVSLE
jgi:predicted amidophosphoribosyltransferase